MKNNISDSGELRNIINSFYLSKLCKQIDEQIGFIKKIISFNKSYLNSFNNSVTQPDTTSLILKNYHAESFTFLEKKELNITSKNFEEDFKDFVNALNDFTESKDEIVTEVQKDERFINSGKERLSVKLRKPFKKLFYQTSKIPRKINNRFRKIFKKPVRPEHTWKQKIPLKRMTAYHYRDSLAIALLSVFNEAEKTESSTTLALWKFDEELNSYFNKTLAGENEIPVPDPLELNKEIEKLNELKKSLHERSELILNNEIQKFTEAYEKAGTIELPFKFYNQKTINKKHEELKGLYKKEKKGWLNNHFALFEDWKLNKEIYLLKSNVNIGYNQLKKNIHSRIDSKFLPLINSIEKFLYKVKVEISSFIGSSGELKSLLHKEKNRIENKLTNIIIPEASDVLLAQNIPSIVDDFEIQLENEVKKISDKRAVVKTKEYDEKLEDSEIEYISPREIIFFEALPDFNASSGRYKSKIMDELENAQRGFLDIDQIADFNLESALSMFRAEKRTGEDPVDIAVEGLERALNKTDEIKNNLISIKKLIETDYLNSTEKFNSNLIKLTETENVLQIKLNIAKVKAIRRTKELRDRAITNAKNIIPEIISGLKIAGRKVRIFYKNLKDRIGLASKPTSISAEISDYLAATQSAVSKLPFVYQRLFQNEPLEDQRFFEGREKELDKLFTAYNSWQKGNYAPAVVVGEKGSGATTILNFYLQNYPVNYNVIRVSVKQNIYDEAMLIDFLKNLFKKGNFKNADDVIYYLNNHVGRQVIIIENIQNLYLKKVNGFNCLKIMLEIISETNKNVFWIFTSTIYSWNYLMKVMNITDHFGYVINIGELKDDQINDIILKRHRISGYKIIFEPTGNDLRNKNFRKLSEKEQQVYLKNAYFSSLNKFAKSNISLALLFWLRSTKEVTSNIINIGSIQELDYSFLNILSSEKIFIIYDLLIHDGLTEEDLSKIFNQHLKQTRLILHLLYDDGIIIKKDKFFLINPLLYRQIVNLLQAKNIIH